MGIKAGLRKLLNIGDKITDIGGALGIPVIAQINAAEEALSGMIAKKEFDEAKAIEALVAAKDAKASIILLASGDKTPLKSKKFTSIPMAIIGMLGALATSYLGVEDVLVQQALDAIWQLALGYLAVQGGLDLKDRLKS